MSQSTLVTFRNPKIYKIGLTTITGRGGGRASGYEFSWINVLGYCMAIAAVSRPQ